MLKALFLVVSLVCLLACPVVAQESASYLLTEHTLNAGGTPSDGAMLTSANYEITLGAIAVNVVTIGLSSASYVMDSGFGCAYPPPGEVVGIRFTDQQTLGWDPERSTGDYNLYRGLFSSLDGVAYGSCQEQDILVNTTTDSEPVPVGDGYFYLITAENRLGEEGTMGTESSGEAREFTACP